MSLRAALHMAASGQIDQATPIFLTLLQDATDPGIKLQAALGIVGTVNSVQNNQLLLDACDAGLGVADRLNRGDVKAFLMAKKALCLLFVSSQHRYARRLLILAPGWKDFSLEADRDEFDRLTKAINEAESQADKLTDDALQLARAAGDMSIEAHVTMMRGEFFGSKCLDFQLEHLREAKRYRVLKRLGLGDFAYTRQERKRMGSCLAACRESYLQAARLFQRQGDEAQRATALYNLANSLRSGNRFREASLHLSEARALARKLNDETLLSRVDALDERIRTRNRTVPDYVGGRLMR